MPRRLLSDDRLLTLELSDRAVLLSLYLCADEHGRFDAGEMALRRGCGVVTGEPLRPIVDRLAASGLVHLYEARSKPFGCLDGFDEDITADHTKKRPRPSFPAPPVSVWLGARCSGVYRGGQDAPSEDQPTVGQDQPTVGERDAKAEDLNDRTLIDQRSDGERLKIGNKEREEIQRERVAYEKRSPVVRSMDDHLATLPKECRNAACAWLVEVAKVRRRNGGALHSETKAEHIAHEYAHRLAELAAVGVEAFNESVEAMLSRGKGFGRGMPNDGVAYLSRMVRGYDAEKANAKAAEAKPKRRRFIKDEGFRRIGPAPQAGEIDTEVDSETADLWGEK